MNSVTNSNNVLFYAPNSPYARMCRAFLGLNNLTGLFNLKVEDLKAKSKELLQTNPQGKVPTLIFNNEIVIDSKEILKFFCKKFNLEHLGLNTSLEDKVFETGRKVMDLAKTNFYERVGSNRKEVIELNEKQIQQLIVELNTDCPNLDSTLNVTVAKIAIVCALDYARNRGQYDWTQIGNIEQLKGLHQELSILPAFVNTMPAKL